MKHILIPVILIISIFLMFFSCQQNKKARPRVFVFTGINIDSGGPG